MARANDFNQRTINAFHEKQGRGVGPWGDNLLLMTSTGRASGERIITPLVNYRLDGSFVVAASKGGAPDHPEWLHNVETNPEVEVEIPDADGTRTVHARARIVREGEERDRLYQGLIDIFPSFADYETKTDRKIAVVVLEPTDQG